MRDILKVIAYILFTVWSVMLIVSLFKGDMLDRIRYLGRVIFTYLLATREWGL